LLEDEPGLPNHAHAAGKDFWNAFPELRAVRDSLAHIAERTIGKGIVNRKLVDIQAQPFVSGNIQLGFVIESFVNRSFVATTASGPAGQVDITAATLIRFRDHVEKLFAAFNWEGGPRLFPGPVF